MIHQDLLLMLGQDAALMNLLPGQLWDTPLAQPMPGEDVMPWHTPGAFDAADGIVKPCGVMIPARPVPSSQGAEWGMVNASLRLFVYGSYFYGTDAVANALERARIVLTTQPGNPAASGDGFRRYVGVDGRRYRVGWEGDSPGIRDDQVNERTWYGWCGFRVTYQRPEVTL